MDSRQQIVVRVMSAMPAADASENIKNFKIYRWDPNEKVIVQYLAFGDPTCLQQSLKYHHFIICHSSVQHLKCHVFIINMWLTCYNILTTKHIPW